MLIQADVRITAGNPKAPENENQSEAHWKGDQEQGNSDQSGSQQSCRGRLVRPAELAPGGTNEPAWPSP